MIIVAVMWLVPALAIVKVAVELYHQHDLQTFLFLFYPAMFYLSLFGHSISGNSVSWLDGQPTTRGDAIIGGAVSAPNDGTLCDLHPYIHTSIHPYIHTSIHIIYITCLYMFGSSGGPLDNTAGTLCFPLFTHFTADEKQLVGLVKAGVTLHGGWTELFES